MKPCIVIVLDTLFKQSPWPGALGLDFTLHWPTLHAVVILPNAGAISTSAEFLSNFRPQTSVFTHLALAPNKATMYLINMHIFGIPKSVWQHLDNDHGHQSSSFIAYTNGIRLYAPYFWDKKIRNRAMLCDSLDSLARVLFYKGCYAWRCEMF